MRQFAWHRVRTSLFLFVMRFWRGMTFGVRAALVDGDEVLLVRHTYVPGWYFPGGGVEAGETALDSLYREVREETGCEMAGAPVLFGLYHNVHVSRRDHVALYVCNQVKRGGPFRPTREIAEARWFSRHALPDELSPGTGRRIAEIFEDAPVSATW